MRRFLPHGSSLDGQDPRRSAPVGIGVSTMAMGQTPYPPETSQSPLEWTKMCGGFIYPKMVPLVLTTTAIYEKVFHHAWCRVDFLLPVPLT